MITTHMGAHIPNTVGGSAAIQTTGKGERLSTLLEVIGIISALVLGLAMEGFAGIGSEEFDFLVEQHGEDYMARQHFAEHFFRSNALHCTATARILIPAECSAVS